MTPLTQTSYNLSGVKQLDLSRSVLFSDQNISNITASFDGKTSTYYGSPNPICWIGIDIGQGLSALVDRVRFFTNLDWINAANMILSAKFEGSNDQTTWTTIGTVDQTVHNGWNVIVTTGSPAYRYIRFLHNSTSQCNLAEVQLFGVVYSSTNVASIVSQASQVTYNDGLNSIAVSQGITYTDTNTAIV